MIFVTVGTHEQSFNRLVEYIDNLKRDGLVDEEVIIQTGYCTYEPNYCIWKKLYPYQEMLKFVSMARVVITHGGPSSFIMPLHVGKIPIVVPRQKQFGEHVNNHQVYFANEVAKRMGNIITVNDVNELGDIINNYNKIISAMSENGNISNNENFNIELEKIVDKMFEVKK